MLRVPDSWVCCTGRPRSWRGHLRALKDAEEAPLGRALAACSWALVSMLQAMALAEPSGSQANEVAGAMAAAREELAAAQGHLDALDQQMTDLAGELESVIAAAHDAMRGQANGREQ